MKTSYPSKFFLFFIVGMSFLISCGRSRTTVFWEQGKNTLIFVEDRGSWAIMAETKCGEFTHETDSTFVATVPRGTHVCMGIMCDSLQLHDTEGHEPQTYQLQISVEKGLIHKICFLGVTSIGKTQHCSIHKQDQNPAVVTCAM